MSRSRRPVAWRCAGAAPITNIPAALFAPAGRVVAMRGAAAVSSAVDVAFVPAGRVEMRGATAVTSIVDIALAPAGRVAMRGVAVVIGGPKRFRLGDSRLGGPDVLGFASPVAFAPAGRMALRGAAPFTSAFAVEFAPAGRVDQRGAAPVVVFGGLYMLEPSGRVEMRGDAPGVTGAIVPFGRVDQRGAAGIKVIQPARFAPAGRVAMRGDGVLLAIPTPARTFTVGALASGTFEWNPTDALIDPALVEGGGDAYLRHVSVDVSARRVRLRLSVDRDGEPSDAGPHLTSAFELAGSAIKLATGSHSVTISGPRVDDVLSDTSEPYYWSVGLFDALFLSQWQTQHNAATQAERDATTITLSDE